MRDSRRDFFLSTTLTLSSLLSQGCVSQLSLRESETQVIQIQQSQIHQQTYEQDEFLSSFPKKINGIREIEFFPSPNPDAYIIFIRQYHHIPGISEEKLRKVESVQKDIYSALKDLSSKYPIKSFYLEGISINEENTANQLCSLWRSVDQITKEKLDTIHLLDNSRLWHSDSCEITRDYLINRIEKPRNAFLKRMFIYHGAPYVISKENGAQLNAAEQEELNKRAGEAIDNFSEDAKRLVLKEREDMALTYLTGNDEKIKVLLFGALHDFRTNVYEWNTKGNRPRYSLITLTPNSVE